MAIEAHSKVSRGVRLWVGALCLCVFAMVMIGGITRLTRSGLSIVEWKPISGILPPLSDDAWHEAFEAYRRFPEYQQVNKGMSLDEFKEIYFWEYLHRLVGRISGLVLGVPLLLLAFRRRLSATLLKKLTIALALGGMQGLLGWYMVKSGLVSMPRVSHYRLAAHLSLAFFMFAFLFWTFLGLRAPFPAYDGPAAGARGVKRAMYGITATLAAQIIYGAFVAGMRAGYGYNTFPLMEGRIVPEGAWALAPLWLNFLENPATIQFVHRTIAWILAISVALYWWRIHVSDVGAEIKRASRWLAAATALQFAIGVVTILTAVPVGLGVLHQIGAFVLLGTAVYGCYVTTAAAEGAMDGVAKTPRRPVLVDAAADR